MPNHTTIRFLSFLTGGLLRPRNVKSDQKQPTLQAPKLFFEDSLAQNSLYQYYLSLVSGYDVNNVPPIEIVLRTATVNGLFRKDYSTNGNLTFIDSKTGDTLVLDIKGKIYASNNVTRPGNTQNY